MDVLVVVVVIVVHKFLSFQYHKEDLVKEYNFHNYIFRTKRRSRISIVISFSILCENMLPLKCHKTIL